MARLTANVEAGALGEVIDEVRGAVAAAGMPDGATAEMGGQDDELQVSLDSLQLALVHVPERSVKAEAGHANQNRRVDCGI